MSLKGQFYFSFFFYRFIEACLISLSQLVPPRRYFYSLMSNICLMSVSVLIGASVNRLRGSSPHPTPPFETHTGLSAGLFKSVCLCHLCLQRWWYLFKNRSLVWKGMQLWARKNKTGANYKKIK